MNKITLGDEKNPREIPTREDPERPYPNKAPGTEPGKNNPRNPQDNETKRMSW